MRNQSVISDLGESGIRRVDARVPFGRFVERRGAENVEAASAGYLYEKSESDQGAVRGSLREH